MHHVVRPSAPGLARHPWRAGALVASVGAALSYQLPAAAQAVNAATTPDETIAALAFLEGRWRIPAGDPALEQYPALARLNIVEATWVVGGKAMRWLDHVGPDRPAEAEGLVYWDPALEKIRFVGVGGPGAGQGRLFVGTWTPLADGRVERLYDVYYRTPADTPGEELGGSRRRYRDVWATDGPDAVIHTLEWWHEGRWQPYARGTYRLVRAGGAG